MTDTQKALQEMFTFNTGSHTLDSGGAYGRHHERRGKGKIYYDDEGKGYCPICGELLIAC